MKLDEMQKQKVAAWVAEGLKLSDIQKRISAEFGLTLTYMETRFLVDDLKLVLRDEDRPKVEPASPLTAPAGPAGAGAAAGKATPAPTASPAQPAAPASSAAPLPGGGVSVSVDTVTRPGALVSGSVRFSDGQAAAWYMDQYGRMGVVPQQQGYKPSAADVEAFQRALETELSRLGL